MIPTGGLEGQVWVVPLPWKSQRVLCSFGMFTPGAGGGWQSCSSLWREGWVGPSGCLGFVLLWGRRHEEFTRLVTLLIPAHLAGPHHPQPGQQLTLSSIKQNGLVSFKNNDNNKKTPTTWTVCLFLQQNLFLSVFHLLLFWRLESLFQTSAYRK